MCLYLEKFCNKTKSNLNKTVENGIYSGDIDIVAAMGDSITAGTGANALTLFEFSTENRGLSFSIGG